MRDLASVFLSELPECFIGTNLIGYDGYGNRISRDIFYVRIATHLLVTGERPISFHPNVLQFPFPRVLFVLISSPSIPTITRAVSLAISSAELVSIM